MMIRKLLHKAILKGFLGLFVLLTSYSSFAQYTSKYERDLHNQAFEYLELKDYQSAIRNYEQLIQLHPNHWLYYFELGLAHLHSPKNKTEGIPYFERTMQMFGTDTLPEIFYYLGRSYQLDHRFEEAINMYNVFLGTIKVKSKQAEKLKSEIDNYIKMCQHGIYHLKLNEKNPLRNEENTQSDVKKYYISKDEYILIENLGGKVNTPFSDYAPVFTSQESTLIFTSRRGDVGGEGELYIDGKFYEDIFVSLFKDGDWSEPVKIDYNNLFDKEFTNSNSHHNATVSVNADETMLFSYTNNHIYVSHKFNDVWMAPEKLGKNINGKKNIQTSAYIYPDGKTLMVVSDQDGYGGTDIFESKLQEDGTWGKLENIGPVVNTEQNEDSPYLMPDGVTLYFSSQGHSSVGGFDIFRSKKIGGEWTTPVSLGIPINSPADETHYMVSEVDNRWAYYSSSREDGYGDMDIYKITRRSEEKEMLEEDIPDLDLAALVQIDSIVTEIEKVQGKLAADLALTQLKNRDISVTKALETYMAPDFSIEDVDVPEEVLASAKASQEQEDFFSPEEEDFYDIPLELSIDMPELAPEIAEAKKRDLEQKQTDTYKEPDMTDPTEKEPPVEEPPVEEPPVEEPPVEEPPVEEPPVEEPPVEEPPVEEPPVEEPPVEEPPVEEPPVEEPPVEEPPVETPADKKDKDVTFDVTTPDSEPQETTPPKETQLDKQRKINEDLLRDILFGFNADQLNDENRKQLRELKKWMDDNPTELLNLAGHADDRGTNEVNQVVSRNRALMVFNYLVAQGADPMKISYNWFGEEKPKVPNTSAANRQANRRVELSLERTQFFTYVTFGFDSYALNDKAKKTINDVYHFLAVNTEAKVHLSGFTDKIGNPNYNKLLSKRRVKAAYDLLISKGIDASRMTYDSYGEEKPSVPDNYPNSGALNRRVEFRIK